MGDFHGGVLYNVPPLDCDASFVVSPLPGMGGRSASYEAWNNGRPAPRPYASAVSPDDNGAES